MYAVKVLALLLFVAVSTEGLRCRVCDPKSCVAPVGCKGGLTHDVCICCQKCAKVLDEPCGGSFDLSGICDVGLECSEPVNSEGVFDFYNDVGKCKAKKIEG